MEMTPFQEDDFQEDGFQDHDFYGVYMEQFQFLNMFKDGKDPVDTQISIEKEYYEKSDKERRGKITKTLQLFGVSVVCERYFYIKDESTKVEMDDEISWFLCIYEAFCTEATRQDISRLNHHVRIFTNDVWDFDSFFELIEDKMSIDSCDVRIE